MKRNMIITYLIILVFCSCDILAMKRSRELEIIELNIRMQKVHFLQHLNFTRLILQKERAELGDAITTLNIPAIERLANSKSVNAKSVYGNIALHDVLTHINPNQKAFDKVNKAFDIVMSHTRPCLIEPIHLFPLVQCGKHKEVARILLERPELAAGKHYSKYKGSWSAMEEAIMAKDQKMVRMLLMCGVDIFEPCGENTYFNKKGIPLFTFVMKEGTDLIKAHFMEALVRKAELLLQ